MAADETKREPQTQNTLRAGNEVLANTSYTAHVAVEAALSNSFEEDCDEETRRRRGGGVVLNRQAKDVSMKRAAPLTLRSPQPECKLEGDVAEGSGRVEGSEQAEGGDHEEETRQRRGGGIATSDTRVSNFPERSSSFVLRNATQHKSAVERHQPEWTGTQ
jgi:hypothetical protein